jgi:thimet oligopeptidase
MNARLVIGVFAIGIISLVVGTYAKKKESHMLFHSYKPSEVVALFPTTAQEIDHRVANALSDAQKSIDAIIAVAPEQRSYANTVKALDAVGAMSDLAITAPAVEVLEMVSPDKVIRDAAHAALLKIQNFVVDAISNNVQLYRALKEYAQGNGITEELSADQKYYLDKVMEDFKQGGLDLPEDQLAQAKNLKKELAALELSFGANIAQDNRTMKVTREGLQGLESDFIANLKKNDDGTYVLGVDYPTYFAVMENCSVEQTRKDLMHMFENRAYPINDAILQEIIAKRDQLAKKIGFASYADLDLNDQMVQSPTRAKQFINDLLAKAQKKERQEFEQIAADLPAGVVLTADGKIKPWDMMYAKNQYKKKHYDVDEQKIAEYFPMEKTVAGLLDIYQKFFSVKFKELKVSSAWHEDVNMLEVHDAATDALLGYFLLDLYPRDNKYSHACQVTILPATYLDDAAIPAIALVIANFPKSTNTKPSLLKRKDVVTFFHEFGHALHTLFGRTQIASLSGTSVKRDFVEMPSQMLEEWLTDADMLKLVSSHYQTNEPLSDDLIKRILDLKNFSSGAFVSGQLMYALLSLELFGDGQSKDVHALYKKLYEACKKYVAYTPDDHMYVAFGHLTGYGAKYYGYMWSKVFALDLFYEIKKHGLLNPAIGAKYIADVIGKGGSEDPNILLKNFLGREPNQEAFLKDLGL